LCQAVGMHDLPWNRAAGCHGAVEAPLGFIVPAGYNARPPRSVISVGIRTFWLKGAVAAELFHEIFV
jgi:hypothetical protein